MQKAPDQIIKLIEQFHRSIDTYKSTEYNETSLRVDFVNPFFKALGWDVDNEQGTALAYRDVIHEASLKMGGTTKAPDYCFRFGCKNLFYIETKKPAIDLNVDPAPAYQVRRYGWNAKLPLSILTDFEEFAVYDCRVRPKMNAKPSTARLLYITYDQYIERWDEIASIFSREAVRIGDYDRFTQNIKGHRGTAEVDVEFLKEIESWREILAKSIALRNPGLNIRELNFAVQKTIDRIIFLRMCEDRGIENENQLLGLTNAKRIYPRLIEVFEKADQKYNSGLFHFREEKNRPGTPDKLSLSLKIDDAVLEQIIKRLYFPESPYEFSIMPPEILGNVYEQFLGKVIRLTKGHQAKIEEKPEVRKAGGVYYTPQYIVDYIVKNTVGKLIHGKTPQQISDLRILDPSCGSGSFLLGAFQFLLNFHLHWYFEERKKSGKTPTVPPPKGKRKKKSDIPAMFETSAGDWALTTAEKKRILLNNIYGVDIDTQAVEVTKLSLLLKVLENETNETLAIQQTFWRERALPDLANNIKCGNSLISTDIYSNYQLDMFDEDLMYSINAFDWYSTESGFGSIFNRGGFDCIIGNPPWGASFTESERDYLRKKNSSIIVRMTDSFMYFVFQTSNFLSDGGYYGIILPDVVLYQIHNRKLREYIVDSFQVLSVLNLGDVFINVTRPASILVFYKSNSTASEIVTGNLTEHSKVSKSAEINNENNFQTVSKEIFDNLPNKIFVTNNFDQYKILLKIKKITDLVLNNWIDEYGIQRGVSPDLKEAFIIDKKTAEQHALEKKYLKPVLTGGNTVKRFFIHESDELLIYTTKNDNFSTIPHICEYINSFEKQITCKEVIEKKHPIYSLHRPRNPDIFTRSTKFVGVITTDKIIIAIDNHSYFVTDGLYIFNTKIINPYYVLGLLNSNLITFMYRLFTTEKGRVLAQVKPEILKQLPVIDPNLNNIINQYSIKIAENAQTLEHFYSELHKSKYDDKSRLIRGQIESILCRINSLVYKCYQLEDSEIELIDRYIR